MLKKATARAAGEPCTVTVRITWKPNTKQWLVDCRYWTGSHWARYWKTVDSTHEIDQWGARKIMEAVSAEIESWLPGI